MAETSGSIVIRTPDDMHVHLRQGRALAKYARRTAASFARALVMPNLLPPVATPQVLTAYRDLIRRSAPGFEPLMTFKLLPGMTAELVASLKESGAVAGKYYPEGVTTNAEDGIRNVNELYPILEVMEELGLVLCIHGEDPAAPVLERERRFLPQFGEMARRFPRLKMVLEHVSTKEAVDLVRALPGTIAATVTVHHLLFTLEDMMASGLHPELYCKPVVKTEADREAIREAVLEGNPKFFFGSDSAPHPAAAKTASPAAAGVYSAPVAVPLLLEFFETRRRLGSLEGFISRFGARFYGLPILEGTAEWVKAPWKVPRVLDGAIPLCAGRELSWQKKPPAEDGRRNATLESQKTPKFISRRRARS